LTAASTIGGVTAGGVRLGIDFGTTHTVAFLGLSDGRLEPLLFDASPLLSSAVYAAPDGQLLTGQDAERGGWQSPGRLEPNPKLRIDDGRILLGSQEYPVLDLIAAVLARVATEAVRVAGGAPREVVLTHPASWAGPRRAVLVGAAERAGLGGVVLVPEPLAAAGYFNALGSVAPGAAVAVYDLGGGTFDVSAVVPRLDGGWAVVASDGLDDVGGLDLDAALLDHIGRTAAAREPRRWQRLVNPTGDDDRRRTQAFRADVRAAKEQLSRTASATVHVPLLNADVYLTREEFEELARPWLLRTVELTAGLLDRAARAGRRPDVLCLVGGSSRIPLVATLLHQRLGIAPTVTDQPELGVAQGSLLANLDQIADVPPAAPAPLATGGPWPPGPGPAGPAFGAPAAPGPVPGGPVSGAPMAPGPVPGGPVSGAPGPIWPAPATRPPRPAPRRSSAARLALVFVAVVALLAVGIVAWNTVDNDRNGGGESPPTGGNGNSNKGGAAARQSVKIERTLWYAGLSIRLGTANYDREAKYQLTIDAVVKNESTLTTGAYLPMTFTLAGKPWTGDVRDHPRLSGGTSIATSVEIAIDDPVADLRAGVLSIGENKKLPAVVPFDSPDRAATLEPRTLLDNASLTRNAYEFTAVRCELRGDLLDRFEQVEQGTMGIGCHFDVKLLRGNLDYLVEPRNIQLRQPDGTTLGPTAMRGEIIKPLAAPRNNVATFVVRWPAPGQYSLILSDRGRYFEESPSPANTGELPFQIPAP